MKTILITLLLCITLNVFAPNISPFKRVKLINEQKTLTHREKVVKTIISIESGGVARINYEEMSVGVFQIRQVYLDELCRHTNKKYKLEDMMNDSIAQEVFELMMDLKCKTWDIDSVVMIHNAGGTTLHDFKITTGYRITAKKLLADL